MRLVHRAPNVGPLATLGGPTSLPDEINYAAGVEFVVEPRLTIVGDVLGRSLRDAGRLTVVSKPFQYVTRTGGPVQTTNFDEFDPIGKCPRGGLVAGWIRDFDPAPVTLVRAAALGGG